MPFQRTIWVSGTCVFQFSICAIRGGVCFRLGARAWKSTAQRWPCCGSACRSAGPWHGRRRRRFHFRVSLCFCSSRAPVFFNLTHLSGVPSGARPAPSRPAASTAPPTMPAQSLSQFVLGSAANKFRALLFVLRCFILANAVRLSHAEEKEGVACFSVKCLLACSPVLDHLTGMRRWAIWAWAGPPLLEPSTAVSLFSSSRFSTHMESPLGTLM